MRMPWRRARRPRWGADGGNGWLSYADCMTNEPVKMDEALAFLTAVLERIAELLESDPDAVIDLFASDEEETREARPLGL